MAFVQRLKLCSIMCKGVNIQQNKNWKIQDCSEAVESCIFSLFDLMEGRRAFYDIDGLISSPYAKYACYTMYVKSLSIRVQVSAVHT